VIAKYGHFLARHQAPRLPPKHGAVGCLILFRIRMKMDLSRGETFPGGAAWRPREWRAKRGSGG